MAINTALQKINNIMLVIQQDSQLPRTPSSNFFSVIQLDTLFTYTAHRRDIILYTHVRTFSCICSPTVLAHVALNSLTRIWKVTLGSCAPSTAMAAGTYTLCVKIDEPSLNYGKFKLVYKCYMIRVSVINYDTPICTIENMPPPH